MTALLVLFLVAAALVCGGWLAWVFRSIVVIVALLTVGEALEDWLRRRRSRRDVEGHED